MTDQPVYDVQLTTYLYGGEVLGRLPDGRAVFVPFGIPGEIARVRLIEERRNFARAELVEVLAPAPERIEPRCIHFGVCGGCHYQHMPYEVQLAAKTGILKDQLQRIGKLQDPNVLPIIPSPHDYYYRNHVQFHLTPEGKLGYHLLRSDEVFAIHECHLPEAPLNHIWPQMDFEPVEEVERIGLRTGADEDVQIVLESSQLEAPEMEIEDLPISVVFLDPAGPIVMAGSEDLVMQVKERPFRVTAGAFFQVNTPMAAAMVDHFLDNLDLDPNATVLDVYCGVGLFSAFLAPRVGQLIGIESNPQATEDFVVNLDEFDNVALYEGEAEDVLPHLNLQPQVVLVDPPRSGLDTAVLDALKRMAPATIAYVSCDPATLARDARRLVEGGYRLRQVTPFDLFPQTYHIESISFWDRS